MVPKVKAFVERVVIENFKSIQRLELRLLPGMNVLVGPNASGKTNILEAFYFLYKALIEEPNRVPYKPYAPEYWEPSHVIYGMDKERELRYSIDVAFRILNEGGGAKEGVLEVVTTLTVKFRVTPDNLTILPTELGLRFQGGEYEAIFREGDVEVRIRNDIYEAVKDRVNKLGRMVSRRSIIRFERIDDYAVAHVKVPRLFILFLLRILTHDFNAPYYFTSRTKDGIVYYETEIFPYLSRIPVAYRVRRRGIEAFKGYRMPPSRHLSRGFVYLDDVVRVISNVLLLKHPDVGRLREFQAFRETERLDMRAANLPQIVQALRMRSVRFQERLDHALDTLFPGVSVEVLPVHGRVALVAREGDLELPPPNVPDGLFKLLAILAGVSLKPSVLLIDELENSMHYRMLEYVVDMLNGLEIPVIVATHSPQVVDLVGLERVLVVRKDPEEGTVVERFENVEELRTRLEELGVSYGDYVFHAAQG